MGVVFGAEKIKARHDAMEAWRSGWRYREALDTYNAVIAEAEKLKVKVKKAKAASLANFPKNEFLLLSEDKAFEMVRNIDNPKEINKITAGVNNTLDNRAYIEIIDTIDIIKIAIKKKKKNNG